jgi:hypothetical protein
LNKFTPETRKIWMTKVFSKPVNFIETLVKELSTRIKSHKFFIGLHDIIRNDLDIPEFMMYSAHDSTVAPAWDFLKPFLYYWDYIPYASFIQI